MFTRDKETLNLLFLIFVLALGIRFLFFPENIYFGFDQARDALVIQELLHGHLKIIGPRTSTEGLFHGPIFYYLYAPFYFLGQGDPVWVSAFLRVANALGVFWVFYIAKTIFSKKVGLLAAFLYAVSFEQSQFSIYISNVSLSVLSVLTFYLGLVMLIFEQKRYGLLISLVGLGLSIQFEFALIYLTGVLIVILLLFRSWLKIVEIKGIVIALIGFLMTMATFIIAELKFHFQMTQSLPNLFRPTVRGDQYMSIWDNLVLISQRFVHDNLWYWQAGSVAFLIVVAGGWMLIKNGLARTKIFFLLIWMVGGIVPYFRNQDSLPIYLYSVGASVGLLISAAWLIENIQKKTWLAAILLMIIVIISNLVLIFEKNPKGSIPEINVQSGMLLAMEKKIIDLIYFRAKGEEFAVNALTMPYGINTTWSYLFEWYGQKTYGYLPIWGQETAFGYPGNLRVVNERSKLPDTRFTIIEPTRGINQPLIDDYLKNEDFFTHMNAAVRIGDFVVQERVGY